MSHIKIISTPGLVKATTKLVLAERETRFLMDLKDPIDILMKLQCDLKVEHCM